MREIGGGQRVALAEHGGAEQGVLELADVARPAVGHQHGKRVVGDRERAHARLLGERREQVAGERGNVALRSRSGGQDDVEPDRSSRKRPGRPPRRAAVGRAMMRTSTELDAAADRADLAGLERASS